MITLKYRRLSWYGVALIPGAAEPGERGRETKVPKRERRRSLRGGRRLVPSRSVARDSYDTCRGAERTRSGRAPGSLRRRWVSFTMRRGSRLASAILGGELRSRAQARASERGALCGRSGRLHRPP